MKRLYGCLVLFLYYFPAWSQVAIEQIPRDLQLYPRDTSNQAEVVVSGRMTSAGYNKIGMQVLREGKLTKVVSQTLAPAVDSTRFRLATIIKAEPAEYQFRVFIYKGPDSTLVADRKRVVCGDVYIIHGQSNALALAGLDQFYSFNFDDKYLRNATYPYNSANIPADMSWYPAKQPYASLGGFGLTLQRLILQTYGIPTCILNGAQGGTAITDLTARNPVNHADLSTIYGRLLYRAQWAGVAKQVKAIIWKQGEEDAGSGLPGYDQKFTKLYNQFREDYGNARIYVGQIDILPNPQDSAAALRDFQRRTKYLFKNVETIATVGTPGHGEDGVHYSPEAHQQMAFEQFRLVARDFYGATDTLQINSPDIRKVYYNARRDSLTLVFGEQMQMVWKSDTAFYDFSNGALIAKRELKDYFYLDGQAGLVTGGAARGNRILLGLKQPATAETLRYLPAYFDDGKSNFYNGPTLRNTRGMRAFSFDNVPIADAIAPVTTLAAKPLSDKAIQLTWTAPATAQTQVLERADSSSASYRPVASLSATVATYTDNTLPNPLATYRYRLRAFSPTSESLYSNVVSAVPLMIVMSLEPTRPAVRLYPNPVMADRRLTIESGQTPFTGLILRDERGQTVKTWQGAAQSRLSLSLDDLRAGLYIADLQTDGGTVLRRKVIVQ